MRIEDKVAVITGGARGFGKRLAELIVDNGGKVVLGDILDEGALVARELNRRDSETVAVFQKCDVSNLSDIDALIKRAIDEFGILDIMVNNAGVVGSLLWTDNSTSYEQVIDINLKAPIEGTRLAVKYFLETGIPGCVVNVASMMAFYPMEYGPVYGATKSALVNFTASCATLAQLNPPIRVNAIAPNFANTNMVHSPILDSVHKQKLLDVDEVVVQMIRCIEDERLAGDTIKIMQGMPPVLNKGRKAVASGVITCAKL
ncbi:hypothetical protein LPJ77_004035 [Coemansia sp. RSA 2523]|nr:hypothetical protein LPJ77_004035 [Coemansia sp. RSA 2523]KAJ2143578.1 hypothetical protein IW142_003637 [Coemansia sp. RSA 564]KAJ2167466.1 hypothetical protein GGH15_002092 [Coemansia sp. RSA 562]KAJ2175404.1 hypothetical protein GGH16_000782 [Coemansia sp. RSA 560]KAJ2189685.1 hypothetical protein EV181_001478 [Coemansia sp. RSA 532]KAJ2198733.1 hypothetical protein IW144_001780 [Coemansia sp. RSA 522]KAJ2207496.1 hypothetical protein IW145_001416 [Coemansia sp. RSA 521]KAJ2224331.1 hy